MDKLFEYVLDRHPNFMPTETQEKDSDSEDDIIVATLKRQDKIPKAHVPSYKKNGDMSFGLVMIYMFEFIGKVWSYFILFPFWIKLYLVNLLLHLK